MNRRETIQHSQREQVTTHSMGCHYSTVAPHYLSNNQIVTSILPTLRQHVSAFTTAFLVLKGKGGSTFDLINYSTDGSTY